MTRLHRIIPQAIKRMFKLTMAKTFPMQDRCPVLNGLYTKGSGLQGEIKMTLSWLIVDDTATRHNRSY